MILLGYLSKQLLKYNNDCDIYKSAFIVPQVYSQQLSATLVNMVHPNIVFFNFIRKIEESFSNNCSSTDFFKLVVRLNE